MKFRSFTMLAALACALLTAACDTHSGIADSEPALSAVKITGANDKSMLVVTIQQTSITELDGDLTQDDYTINFVDGAIMDGTICSFQNDKFVACATLTDLVEGGDEAKALAIKIQIRFIKTYDKLITPAKLKELERDARQFHLVPPVDTEAQEVLLPDDEFTPSETELVLPGIQTS